MTHSLIEITASSRIPHTPGPWDYHPKEDSKPIYNHGKFAIAYMDTFTPDEDDGGLWEQETEANGNLVAAAPAQALLLEMLRYGLVSLGDGEAAFEGIMYAFDCDHPDWNALVGAIGWDNARAAVTAAIAEWREP